MSCRGRQPTIRLRPTLLHKSPRQQLTLYFRQIFSSKLTILSNIDYTSGSDSAFRKGLVLIECSHASFPHWFQGDMSERLLTFKCRILARFLTSCKNFLRKQNSCKKLTTASLTAILEPLPSSGTLTLATLKLFYISRYGSRY